MLYLLSRLFDGCNSLYNEGSSQTALDLRLDLCYSTHCTLVVVRAVAGASHASRNKVAAFPTSLP